jgi:plasmid maintenance system antidote protein VapI
MVIKMSEYIEDLRKINLQKLIEKHGNQTAFGKAVDTNPSYISHVINGRRNLGPTLCRKIEKHLGIADGWMDCQH